MAITVIDLSNVARTTFEASHLLSKLQKFILVTSTVGRTYLDPTYINKIVLIDLDD